MQSAKYHAVAYPYILQFSLVCCTSIAPKFLRAIAKCFARLSHRLGVCPFVSPFVRPSHPGTVSKRCKRKSQNLHCTWIAPRTIVFLDKISCRGSSRTRASKKGKKGWWRGVVGSAFRLKRSYSTPGLVSTVMGDCLRPGKPSRCEACQLGRLSLPTLRGTVK